MYEFLKIALGDIKEKTKTFGSSFNSNMGKIRTTNYAEVHKTVNQDQ
jgi:hypothetical protein